jgi:hypothetical protein
MRQNKLYKLLHFEARAANFQILKGVIYPYNFLMQTQQSCHQN